MSKPKNQETNPAARPAATPAAEAPPVNPAAVLADRKRRRLAAGWQTARTLLLQPTPLTEPEVIALAEHLEVVGLSPEWIEPLRMTAKLHEENHVDRETLSELTREFRAAQAKAADREAEIRQRIRELEAQLPGFGKRLTPELEEVSRIGEQVQRLGAMANLQDALLRMFKPLFDSSATVADFALPRIADGLPPAIRAALDAARLIVNNQPVALTEGEPSYKPRPAWSAPPVLECSHGPEMQPVTAPPPRSVRREVREAVIPKGWAK